jgi:hypothetical protein
VNGERNGGGVGHGGRKNYVAREIDSESFVMLRRSKGWTNVVEWDFEIELIQAASLDARIATGDSCHEPWSWPNVPSPLPTAARGPHDSVVFASLLVGGPVAQD